MSARPRVAPAAEELPRPGRGHLLAAAPTSAGRPPRDMAKVRLGRVADDGYICTPGARRGLAALWSPSPGHARFPRLHEARRRGQFETEPRCQRLCSDARSYTSVARISLSRASSPLLRAASARRSNKSASGRGEIGTISETPPEPRQLRKRLFCSRSIIGRLKKFFPRNLVRAAAR